MSESLIVFDLISFFFSDDPIKRAKAFQKVLINIGKSQFVF